MIYLLAPLDTVALHACDCRERLKCVCVCVHAHVLMCAAYEVIEDCSTFNMGITNRKISAPYGLHLFVDLLNSLVLSNTLFLQKREIKV